MQPQQAQVTYQVMGYMVMMVIMAMIGSMVRSIVKEAFAPSRERYLPQTESSPTEKSDIHLPEPAPITPKEAEELMHKVLDTKRQWLRERGLPETISEVNRCVGAFRGEFFDAMGVDLEVVCDAIDGWIGQKEGAVPAIRWAGMAMCTGSAPPLLEYDEEAFGFVDTELGISQDEFLKAMMAEHTFTESALEGAGLDKVTVWRGLTGPPAHQVLRDVDMKGEATIKTHFGSSWSFSRHAALTFAAVADTGAIIRHTAVPHNILSSGVSNGRFAPPFEGELILFCPAEIPVGPDQVERVR